VRSLRRLSPELLVLGALFVASCGIGTDDAPRGIDPATRQELALPANVNAGAATGSARIYLLTGSTNDTGSRLVAVARDVAETPTDLLTALFEGPNTVEKNNDLRSALPTTAKLVSAQVLSGTVVINVSSDLQELSSDVLIDAVAQMVFTAAETGVTGVRIEINGEPRQWPDGTGQLHSDPLTPYDFPGLVHSAQPPYPALPSPA
jgi:spore germination protein GerM